MNKGAVQENIQEMDDAKVIEDVAKILDILVSSWEQDVTRAFENGYITEGERDNLINNGDMLKAREALKKFQEDGLEELSREEQFLLNAVYLFIKNDVSEALLFKISEEIRNNYKNKVRVVIDSLPEDSAARKRLVEAYINLENPKADNTCDPKAMEEDSGYDGGSIIRGRDRLFKTLERSLDEAMVSMEAVKIQVEKGWTDRQNKNNALAEINKYIAEIEKAQELVKSMAETEGTAAIMMAGSLMDLIKAAMNVENMIVAGRQAGSELSPLQEAMESRAPSSPEAARERLEEESENSAEEARAHEELTDELESEEYTSPVTGRLTSKGKAFWNLVMSLCKASPGDRRALNHLMNPHMDLHALPPDEEEKDKFTFALRTAKWMVASDIPDFEKLSPNPSSGVINLANILFGKSVGNLPSAGVWSLLTDEGKTRLTPEELARIAKSDNPEVELLRFMTRNLSGEGRSILRSIDKGLIGGIEKRITAYDNLQEAKKAKSRAEYRARAKMQLAMDNGKIRKWAKKFWHGLGIRKHTKRIEKLEKAAFGKLKAEEGKLSDLEKQQRSAKKKSGMMAQAQESRLAAKIIAAKKKIQTLKDKPELGFNFDDLGTIIGFATSNRRPTSPGDILTDENKRTKLHAAEQLIDSGDYKGAVDILEGLLAANCTNVDAYILYAKALKISAAQQPEKITDVEIIPGVGRANLEKPNTAREDELEGALELLRVASTINPDDVEVKKEKVAILHLLGKDKEALGVADAALSDKAARKDVGFVGLVAEIADAENNMDLAIKAYGLLTELAPDVEKPELRTKLAEALAKKKEAVDKEKEGKKETWLNKIIPVIKNLLGFHYLKTHSKPRAYAAIAVRSVFAVLLVVLAAKCLIPVVSGISLIKTGMVIAQAIIIINKMRSKDKKDPAVGIGKQLLSSLTGASKKDASKLEYRSQRYINTAIKVTRALGAIGIIGLSFYFGDYSGGIWSGIGSAMKSSAMSAMAFNLGMIMLDSINTNIPSWYRATRKWNSERGLDKKAIAQLEKNLNEEGISLVEKANRYAALAMLDEARRDELITEMEDEGIEQALQNMLIQPDSLDPAKQKAIDSEKEEALGALVELAKLYHKAGKTDTAIDTLLIAIGRAKNKVKDGEGKIALRMALADIYLEKKDYSEAKKQLELARNMDPENTEIFKKMIEAYQGLGENEKVISLLEDALRKDITNAEILGLLQDTYIKSGRVADAAKVVTQALQVEPKDEDLLPLLEKVKDAIKERSLEAPEDIEDAKGACEALLTVIKQTDNIKPAQKSLDIALDLVDEEGMDKVLRFEDILSAIVDSEGLDFYQKAVLVRKVVDRINGRDGIINEEEAERLIAAFDNTLGRAKNLRMRAALETGLAIINMKRDEAHLEDGQKKALIHIENAKDCLRKTSASKDSLEKLYELEVEALSIEPHLVIGDNLERKGEYAKAKQHYEQVFKVGSESGKAKAHVKLGEIAMREDDSQVATGHYEEAIKLNPALEEGLRIPLFEACAQTQDDATKAIEMYKEMNPAQRARLSEKIKNKMAELLRAKIKKQDSLIESQNEEFESDRSRQIQNTLYNSLDEAISLSKMLLALCPDDSVAKGRMDELEQKLEVITRARQKRINAIHSIISGLEGKKAESDRDGVIYIGKELISLYLELLSLEADKGERARIYAVLIAIYFGQNEEKQAIDYHRKAKAEGLTFEPDQQKLISVARDSAIKEAEKIRYSRSAGKSEKADAALKLGILYGLRGDVEEAEKQFRWAYWRLDKGRSAEARSGQEELAREEKEKAEPKITAEFVETADDDEIRKALEILAINHKRAITALKRARHMVRQDKKKREDLDQKVAAQNIDLGDIYYQMGELDKATAYYKQALGLGKDSQAAYVGLAKVALMKDETDELVKNLKLAKDLGADIKEEFGYSLKDKVVKALKNKVDSLIADGEFDKAGEAHALLDEISSEDAEQLSDRMVKVYEEQLKPYLEKKKLSRDDKPKVQRLHVLQGDAYRAIGDNENARKAYQSALKLNKHSLGAKLGLGHIALALGNYKKAKKLFNKAAKDESLRNEALTGIVRAYIGLGNVDAVIKSLDNAIAYIEGKNAKAAQEKTKARLLMKEGDEIKDALKGLLENKARELQRDINEAVSAPIVLPFSGFVYNPKSKGIAKLKDVYKKLLELDPENEDIKTRLFELDQELDEEKASAASLAEEGKFDLALEIDPSYSVAHLGLAREFETNGDLEKAIAEYEKALEGKGQAAIDAGIRLIELYGYEDRAPEEQEAIVEKLAQKVLDIGGDMEKLLSKIEDSATDNRVLRSMIKAYEELEKEIKTLEAREEALKQKRKNLARSRDRQKDRVGEIAKKIVDTKTRLEGKKAEYEEKALEVHLYRESARKHQMTDKLRNEWKAAESEKAKLASEVQSLEAQLDKLEKSQKAAEEAPSRIDAEDKSLQSELSKIKGELRTARKNLANLEVVQRRFADTENTATILMRAEVYFKVGALGKAMREALRVIDGKGREVTKNELSRAHMIIARIYEVSGDKKEQKKSTEEYLKALEADPMNESAIRSLAGKLEAGKLSNAILDRLIRVAEELSDAEHLSAIVDIIATQNNVELLNIILENKDIEEEEKIELVVRLIDYKMDGDGIDNEFFAVLTGLENAEGRIKWVGKVGLAYVHARNGELEKARATLREITANEKGLKNQVLRVGLEIDLLEARRSVDRVKSGITLWIRLFQAKRALNKVVRKYEKLVSVRPKAAEAIKSRLAEEIRKQGEDIEKISQSTAIKFYKAAVKIDPSLARAHLALARLYEEQGNVDAAIKSLDNAIVHIENKNAKAAQEKEKARLLVKKSDICDTLDEKQMFLQQALELDPTLAEDDAFMTVVIRLRREAVGMYYGDRAALTTAGQEELDRKEAQIAGLLEDISRIERNITSEQDAGNIKRLERKVARVEEEIDGIKDEMAKRIVESSILLADVYMARGHFDNANRILTEGLRGIPSEIITKNPQIQLRLGRVAFKKGDYSKSSARYVSALELDSRLLEAYLRLAEMYIMPEIIVERNDEETGKKITVNKYNAALRQLTSILRIAPEVNSEISSVAVKVLSEVLDKFKGTSEEREEFDNLLEDIQNSLIHRAQIANNVEAVNGIIDIAYSFGNAELIDRLREAIESNKNIKVDETKLPVAITPQEQDVDTDEIAVSTQPTTESETIQPEPTQAQPAFTETQKHDFMDYNKIIDVERAIQDLIQPAAAYGVLPLVGLESIKGIGIANLVSMLEVGLIIAAVIAIVIGIQYVVKRYRARDEVLESQVIPPADGIEESLPLKPSTGIVAPPVMDRTVLANIVKALENEYGISKKLAEEVAYAVGDANRGIAFKDMKIALRRNGKTQYVSVKKGDDVGAAVLAHIRQNDPDGKMERVIDNAISEHWNNAFRYEVAFAVSEDGKLKEMVETAMEFTKDGEGFRMSSTVLVNTAKDKMIIHSHPMNSTDAEFDDRFNPNSRFAEDMANAKLLGDFGINHSLVIDPNGTIRALGVPKRIATAEETLKTKEISETVAVTYGFSYRSGSKPAEFIDDSALNGLLLMAEIEKATTPDKAIHGTMRYLKQKAQPGGVYVYLVDSRSVDESIIKLAKSNHDFIRIVVIGDEDDRLKNVTYISEEPDEAEEGLTLSQRAEAVVRKDLAQNRHIVKTGVILTNPSEEVKVAVLEDIEKRSKTDAIDNRPSFAFINGKREVEDNADINTAVVASSVARKRNCAAFIGYPDEDDDMFIGEVKAVVTATGGFFIFVKNLDAIIKIIFKSIKEGISSI